MTKLLVLEDSVLGALLGNQALLAAFPFLRMPAGQKTKKCTPCARKKGAAKAQNHLATVKAVIAGFSPQQQRRFKEIVAAEQVKVVYSTGKDVAEVVF